MHFDFKNCEVCGAEVRLRASTPPETTHLDGPVGPQDGVVGGGDPTVDDRICTNADCATHQTEVGHSPTP
jgi:hypothetical protein